MVFILAFLHTSGVGESFSPINEPMTVVSLAPGSRCDPESRIMLDPKQGSLTALSTILRCQSPVPDHSRSGVQYLSAVDLDRR